jgi:hypothetical protein
MSKKLGMYVFLAAFLASRVDCPTTTLTSGQPGTEASMDLHGEIDNITNLDNKEKLELHIAAQKALDSGNYGVGYFETSDGLQVPYMSINYQGLTLDGTDLNDIDSVGFIQKFKEFKTWICLYYKSLGPMQQFQSATAVVGFIKLIKRTVDNVTSLYGFSKRQIMKLVDYFGSVRENPEVVVQQVKNPEEIIKEAQEAQVDLLKILVIEGSISGPEIYRLAKQYNVKSQDIIRDNSGSSTTPASLSESANLYNAIQTQSVFNHSNELRRSHTAPPFLGSQQKVDEKQREERGGAKRTRKQGKKKSRKTKRRKSTNKKHRRTSSHKR